MSREGGSGQEEKDHLILRIRIHGALLLPGIQQGHHPSLSVVSNRDSSKSSLQLISCFIL